mmetsp:Transcript_2174/g.5383  ORF Transcript_2174/g.5383 Transcript_2174/m.5383 type:complete len:139 (-) Transcript_2174:9-425(-)
MPPSDIIEKTMELRRAPGAAVGDADHARMFAGGACVNSRGPEQGPSCSATGSFPRRCVRSVLTNAKTEAHEQGRCHESGCSGGTFYPASGCPRLLSIDADAPAQAHEQGTRHGCLTTRSAAERVGEIKSLSFMWKAYD